MQEDVNVELEAAVSKWLQIAIKQYRFYLDKTKAGFSQNLWNSFTENIIKGSGGSVAKLEINFLYYGRFVDMGVGRGFPIGGRRALGDSNFLKRRNEKGQLLKNPTRKPKKWYSKTTAFEVGRLSDILAKEFGLFAPRLVQSALQSQHIEIEI